MRAKIYRDCACGETAHDAKFIVATGPWVWKCRNCGALARDRRGAVLTLPDTVCTARR